MRSMLGWILFDDYAENFEEELTKQIVELLLENVKNQTGSSNRHQITWNAVLDAGCGSGLVGEAMFNYSDQIFGVDISQEMVKKTRGRKLQDGRKIYTDAKDEELVSYLKARSKSSCSSDAFERSDWRFDLHILTFILGRLSGWLAFSTEDGVERYGNESDRGFVLLNTGR
eukprot:758904-Hanusia_phi.AAC.3